MGKQRTKKRRTQHSLGHMRKKYIHVKTASGTHLFLSSKEFKALSRKTDKRWKRGAEYE